MLIIAPPSTKRKTPTTACHFAIRNPKWTKVARADNRSQSGDRQQRQKVPRGEKAAERRALQCVTRSVNERNSSLSPALRATVRKTLSEFRKLNVLPVGRPR